MVALDGIIIVLAARPFDSISAGLASEDRWLATGEDESDEVFSFST